MHIGPSKTGTTSLQSALHGSRDALLAQGVLYAGSTRHSRRATRAAVGRRSPYFEQPPPIEHWWDLVREVGRASAPRIVASSEILSGAKPDDIRRIVADLDPERVHIAVTLRPLGKIIASQWQQMVRAGSRMTLDQRLRVLLDAPDSKAARAFWWRHRHDQLVMRWAEVVGLEKVTAIVADDRDHDVLLRSFEHLLGLRPGTLSRDEDLVNRSFTEPEAEAVRAFNDAFRARHLSRSLHSRIMARGGTRAMQARVPSARESHIRLPEWAIPRIVEMSREITDGLEACGVRIIGGDVALLRSTPESRPTTGDSASDLIPSDVAASMTIGVLYASGAAGTNRYQTPGEPVELARISNRQLVNSLMRRVRLDVRRWLDRLRQRSWRLPSLQRR